MKKLLIITIFFLVLAGLWILLTLPFSLQEAATGGVVTLMIVVLFRKHLTLFTGCVCSLKTFVYAVPFAIVFLIELVKANIDVALRVIQPRLPINPGIVSVTTRLNSPLGRLFLANAITLTPGTLTVETEGNLFYIHWIDVSAEDIEATTKKIVGKFERYLEIMFG